MTAKLKHGDGWSDTASGGSDGSALGEGQKPWAAVGKPSGDSRYSCACVMHCVEFGCLHMHSSNVSERFQLAFNGLLQSAGLHLKFA